MADLQVGPARSPAAREGGFTLVEILVVLAILGTLLALVAAVIPQALKAKAKTQTSTLVMNIGAALEHLDKDREVYGRYPPTRARDLRFGKLPIGKELGHPNDVNVGIECLFFLLNNPTIPADQVTQDTTLIGNTDGDNWKAARGHASDTEAREYLDAWRTPLVYFHSSDYKDPKGCEQVRNGNGELVPVKPKRMPSSAGGGFLAPNSFQLFSLGPNGVQDPDDAEESDDIVYQGR